MNANNQIPLEFSFASPLREYTQQPIAPWAPPRIRRINTILNEYLDDTEEYPSRHIDSLVFPDMELEFEDEDDEMDIVPNPNVTLFRGNREDSDDEMDIVPNPNITLFRGNREDSDDELDLESDDDDKTVINPLNYDEDAMELEDDSTIVLHLWTFKLPIYLS